MNTEVLIGSSLTWNLLVWVDLAVKNLYKLRKGYHKIEIKQVNPSKKVNKSHGSHFSINGKIPRMHSLDYIWYKRRYKFDEIIILGNLLI